MAKPTRRRKPDDGSDDRKEFNTVEAKVRFGELLSRAGYGDERIIITKHGKKRGALIGMRDLAKLEGAA